MPAPNLANPAPHVTPEHFEQLQREILAEFREAVQRTRLPKFFPSSKWEISIADGVIGARLVKQEFVLQGK